jgi:hypothetical protein
MVAIESERATTYEVVAHAIADMTVGARTPVHIAANLQRFGQKLDTTLAKANELVERLDRAPLNLPPLPMVRPVN